MKSSIIPLGLTTTLLLILISFSPLTSAQPLPRTVRPPLLTGSGTFSFSIPSSSSAQSGDGDGVSPSPFSGVMNGTLNIKEGEPFIVSFSSLPDASGLQADLPFNHVFYSGSAVASSITSPSFQSFSAIVSSSLNIVSGPSFSQGAAAISINLWPTE